MTVYVCFIQLRLDNQILELWKYHWADSVEILHFKSIWWDLLTEYSGYFGCKWADVYCESLKFVWEEIERALLEFSVRKIFYTLGKALSSAWFSLSLWWLKWILGYAQCDFEWENWRCVLKGSSYFRYGKCIWGKGKWIADCKWVHNAWNCADEESWSVNWGS